MTVLHRMRLIGAAVAVGAAFALCTTAELRGARPTSEPVEPIDEPGFAGRGSAPESERGVIDRSFGGGMWGASYFPDIELVSQRGERVRFFDLIRDKVVAINFIYTRCGDSCPMQTARMTEVAALLADRLGKDVFFYSISIDPEHDTPEVLADYARRWKAGDGWTFLTGAETDIVLLRKKLGVYQADRTTRDHDLGIVIGNQQTGRWMKRSPGENPYILANELGSWLHNWKRASTGDRDFAHAPEVRNISTGEELFRARCAACHTVGGGDRTLADARGVGPDLLDVQRRRERSWLIRWIREPDRMLAEGDPIANELFARYQRIAMPNLRISPEDAAQLVTYLEEESAVFHRGASGSGGGVNVN